MDPEAKNTKKLLIPAAVIIGFTLLCCCCGLLGNDDKAEQEMEAVQVEPVIVPAEQVVDEVAAAIDEASEPVVVTIWESDKVVKLRDDDGAFGDHFWSFYDDLAHERVEAAVRHLKSDKPATWESEEAGVLATASEERQAHRANTLEQTFLYRVPGSLDLPSYDMDSGAFPLLINGVVAVDTGLLGGKSGWWLSLGKAPTVDRVGTELTDKSGNPMTIYHHSFIGGSEVAAPIIVPAEEADAFYKTNNGRIKVDLLLRPKDVYIDEGAPEYKIKKTGSVWEIALENATVSAGRAVVVEVVGWRIVVGGKTLSSWEAE